MLFNYEINLRLGLLYLYLPSHNNKHMNRQEHNTNKTSNEDIRNVFKKMLSDKRRISSYIQENGTLNGFKDDTIIFAKPL